MSDMSVETCIDILKTLVDIWTEQKVIQGRPKEALKLAIGKLILYQQAGSELKAKREVFPYKDSRPISCLQDAENVAYNLAREEDIAVVAKLKERIVELEKFIEQYFSKVEGVKYSQIIETNQENTRLRGKLRIAEQQLSAKDAELERKCEGLREFLSLKLSQLRVDDKPDENRYTKSMVLAQALKKYLLGKE